MAGLASQIGVLQSPHKFLRNISDISLCNKDRSTVFALNCGFRGSST